MTTDISAPPSVPEIALENAALIERLRKIKIGSYTEDNGSHSKHFAVRAVCEEAAAEIERLKSERAILRDSAKDVIAWCDANPPAGDALYCIARLRHAIAATEPYNVLSTTPPKGGPVA
jgi:hypothetical protein